MLLFLTVLCFAISAREFCKARTEPNRYVAACCYVTGFCFGACSGTSLIAMVNTW